MSCHAFLAKSLDYIIGLLLIVLVALIIFGSSMVAYAFSQATQAEGWHKAPGGLEWIDAGDGTRCYRGYASSPFSCVRMQP